MVMVSKSILSLAIRDAEMMTPFAEAMALNPVTAISRPSMMTTIQAETAPSWDEQLIRDRVQELAQRGNLFSPPGHDPVERIRERRQDEDYEGGQLFSAELGEQSHDQARDEENPEQREEYGEVHCRRYTTA